MQHVTLEESLQQEAPTSVLHPVLCFLHENQRACHKLICMLKSVRWGRGQDPWPKVLAVLPKDRGWIPSTCTHMMLASPLTPVPEESMFSSGLHRHCTCMQAKHPQAQNKNKPKKKKSPSVSFLHHVGDSRTLGPELLLWKPPTSLSVCLWC